MQFVFELEDGTYLQPYVPVPCCGTDVKKDPLYNFPFEDGKKVFISYHIKEGYFNSCMPGSLVKITCIREASIRHPNAIK